MTLRKVLQTEIWSKRTSRRLASIALSLVIGGLLFGAIVLISDSWITPYERVAMRRALSDVKDLHRMRGDEPVYDAQVRKVQTDIKICKARAITEHDANVTILLDLSVDGASRRKAFMKLPEAKRENVFDTMKKMDQFTDSTLDEMIR